MKKRALVITIILFATLTAYSRNANFTGTWDTNWGKVTLLQNRKRVTGNYTGRFDGKITGIVTKKRLNFKWYQANGEWGKGYFDISSDGTAIIGQWAAGESSLYRGTWSGWKVKNFQYV